MTEAIGVLGRFKQLLVLHVKFDPLGFFCTVLICYAFDTVNNHTSSS